MSFELPDVQAGFRKVRNQRFNWQHPLDHQKSKRVLEKHLLQVYWLCQSLSLCGSPQTGKFFKRWEYQTTLPTFWKICMQIRKQQLDPDMGQRTGPKLGKEYVKAVYCYTVYLTYMQSTSCEMPGWMKHKLESRLPEKYQWSQICRWYHPYGRKRRGTKETLDENERGEWKSWLKSQEKFQ